MYENLRQEGRGGCVQEPGEGQGPPVKSGVHRGQHSGMLSTQTSSQNEEASVETRSGGGCCFCSPRSLALSKECDPCDLEVSLSCARDT
jgi:hypothetical protein